MHNGVRESNRQTTRLLRAESPHAIAETVDRLVGGGVVSFPTDTVYALAASLTQDRALDRLFEIKGRPRAKPIPVLLASVSDLERIAASVDEPIGRLLARRWPGPLTVVVPARDWIADAVTGRDAHGQRTVAVRVPSHRVAIELIERAGGAVAATSANRSGDAPCLSAIDVLHQIGDDVDVILDGGPSPGGVASSVIEVRGTDLIVVREGAIAEADLRAEWQLIDKQTADGLS